LFDDISSAVPATSILAATIELAGFFTTSSEDLEPKHNSLPKAAVRERQLWVDTGH
jgi:hypothetical protein